MHFSTTPEKFNYALRALNPQPQKRFQIIQINEQTISKSAEQN